jgi:hypothetical protein
MNIAHLFHSPSMHPCGRKYVVIKKADCFRRFIKDFIMTIFKTILMGSAGLAVAFGAAAPAAAQYAPNYGYNNGGSTIGAVINSVLGGGRYGAYGQGNDRVAVDQCARAAEARVSHDYRVNGYGNQGYGNQGYDPRYSQQGYGYNGAGTARVIGITAVERRSNGLKVSGVIDSGMNRGYGNQAYGYGNQGYDPRYGNQGYPNQYGNAYGNQAYANNAQVADLRFSCRVDYRGYVTNVDIKRNVAARRDY